MDIEQEHNNRRILILGSEPHSSLVTAYDWGKTPKYLNIADYDIVIINLFSLQSQRNLKGEILDALPSWQQMARLLFSEGSELIIIGFPKTIEATNRYHTFQGNFPLFPQCIFEAGEEIRDIEPEFSYYFRHVSRWFFHADHRLEHTRHDFIAAYLQVAHPMANDCLIEINPLAQTRYQKPIGFEFNYKATYLESRNYSSSRSSDKSQREILKESGKVFWLPPVTDISVYEAINLILKERYSLRIKQTSPDWVKDYKLPLQIPIEKEITEIQSKLVELYEQLSMRQKEVEQEKRFHKLLYEQGEDGLEPIVRETLEILGATVELPKKKGIEDGRVIDSKGRYGLLEIKGKSGTLALKDVRQVDQWIRTAIADDNIEGKGILVINPFCDTPVKERKNPFPDNCIKLAQRFELCLMTTTQLFSALCQHQQNTLDQEHFWDTIFSTNGICALPELNDPE